MLELYKKIQSIQKEIGKLGKKSTNLFFESKFMDLNDLTDALKPLLLKEKLVLIQPIIKGYVTSKVIDIDSGEEFISELELPNLDNPQKIGSCITYYRRYTLKSMFNLQEVDDDGNLAAKPTEQPSLTPQKSNKVNFNPTMNAWKQAVEANKTIDELLKYYDITEDNENIYVIECLDFHSK